MFLESHPAKSNGTCHLPIHRNDRMMPAGSTARVLSAPLIDTGRPPPIENVDQRPSVLIELDLQLSLLIDRKLG